MLILIAFVAALAGRLDRRSYRYLLLNLVGAAVLAADALRNEEWGFLILQSVWTLVAAIGIAQRLLGRAAPQA